METIKKCRKCEYKLEESVTVCPICSTRVITAGRIRGLGVVQLILGLIIVGLMGTITVFLAPKMLGGEEAGFTGTPGQAGMIMLLFGVVIVFGLASCVSGLYHVVVGKRNKWVGFIAVFFGILLLVIMTAVRLFLDV